MSDDFPTAENVYFPDDTRSRRLHRDVFGHIDDEGVSFSQWMRDAARFYLEFQLLYADHPDVDLPHVMDEIGHLRQAIHEQRRRETDA